MSPTKIKYKDHGIDSREQRRVNIPLRYWEAGCYAAIFEDVITQLRILDECSTELRLAKTLSSKTLALELKYGVKQPAFEDALEAIDHKNLGRYDYKINKLVADRNYMDSVATSVYIELSLYRRFDSLLKNLNRMIENKNYMTTLEENVRKNKLIRKAVFKQLRQQRNHNKTVMYDTEIIIEDLKSKIEDSQIHLEMDSRYIDNWQNARTEQHKKIIGNEDSIHIKNSEYYKTKSDHEHRVHVEVELLVNITINETLEKIEHWMIKYETDLEEIDLKIQIQKNKYQDMLEKRIKLDATYEKHEQLMKEWIKFKEDREAQRLYNEKMTKSAIMVQAWWRGLLVRLKLGPYKEKKKKAPKKKYWG